MNISEEKKYLYDMMRELTIERRKITDMYSDLKDRMDELNRLELRGLEDLSVKGYVDLHNVREVARMTTNIEREAAGIIRKIEKEHNVEDEVMTNSTKEDVGIETVPELPTKIDAAVNELENIETPKQTKAYNKSGTTSLDKMTEIIASTLKELGLPIKSKDLYELVNAQLDAPIKRANFSNNVLPRASKINSRINNASHGYWQYLNG